MPCSCGYLLCFRFPIVVGFDYDLTNTFGVKPKQMTVREALNSALDEEMAADPTVFLMGEEVCSTN